MNRIPATVSVDLDNDWAYLMAQGNERWRDAPGYLDQVTPRMLGLFREEGVLTTVFVVGRDAQAEKNHAALRQIADAGHEIANHSHRHEPWLHLYTQEQLGWEFDQSEAAIMSATGVKPRGFRGPGFSTGASVRKMLRERGYAYDSSLFPTWIGPAARFYFNRFAKLSAEERARRAKLYGSMSAAFSPLRPYELESGLMELPVTTMPVLRLPMHLSYLVALTAVMPLLARVYLEFTLALCSTTGVAPNMLLHPTDFLDTTDAPALAFFPGMRVPAEMKLTLVRRVLRAMKRRWPVLPMIESCKTARSLSDDPRPEITANKPQTQTARL